MDVYQIKIKSSNTIQVETIIEVLKNAPNEIYQEDFATFIRSKIPAEITVIGWHHGVKIISLRE